MLAIPLFAIIVKIQVGTATQTMIQHQNLALNANRSKLWLLTYSIKNRFNVFYTVLCTV